MTDTPTPRDRDMAGALFRERDRPSDRHPEMTGYIVINGTRYRLAGWINESKGGRRYLSLKASPDRIEPRSVGEHDGSPPTAVRSVDELAAAKKAMPTGWPTPSALPQPGALDDDLPF